MRTITRFITAFGVTLLLLPHPASAVVVNNNTIGELRPNTRVTLKLPDQPDQEAVVSPGGEVIVAVGQSDDEGENDDDEFVYVPSGFTGEATLVDENGDEIGAFLVINGTLQPVGGTAGKVDTETPAQPAGGFGFNFGIGASNVWSDTTPNGVNNTVNTLNADPFTTVTNSNADDSDLAWNARVGLDWNLGPDWGLTANLGYTGGAKFSGGITSETTVAPGVVGVAEQTGTDEVDILDLTVGVYRDGLFGLPNLRGDIGLGAARFDFDSNASIRGSIGGSTVFTDSMSNSFNDTVPIIEIKLGYRFTDRWGAALGVSSTLKKPETDDGTELDDFRRVTVSAFYRHQ